MNDLKDDFQKTLRFKSKDISVNNSLVFLTQSVFEKQMRQVLIIWKPR